MEETSREGFTDSEQTLPHLNLYPNCKLRLAFACKCTRASCSVVTILSCPCQPQASKPQATLHLVPMDDGSRVGADRVSTSGSAGAEVDREEPYDSAITTALDDSDNGFGLHSRVVVLWTDLLVDPANPQWSVRASGFFHPN